MPLLVVEATFDDDAKVWVVSDSDVPGLATEAASFDELRKKLVVMIPELLDANGRPEGTPISGEVPVEMIAHASERIRREAA